LFRGCSALKSERSFRLELAFSFSSPLFRFAFARPPARSFLRRCRFAFSSTWRPCRLYLQPFRRNGTPETERASPCWTGPRGDKYDPKQIARPATLACCPKCSAPCAECQAAFRFRARIARWGPLHPPEARRIVPSADCARVGAAPTHPNVRHQPPPSPPNPPSHRHPTASRPSAVRPSASARSARSHRPPRSAAVRPGAVSSPRAPVASAAPPLTRRHDAACHYGNLSRSGLP
jgi:hypothetical protein